MYIKKISIFILNVLINLFQILLLSAVGFGMAYFFTPIYENKNRNGFIFSIIFLLIGIGALITEKVKKNK